MNTFEKYINIYINIECLFLIENKSDVNFTFKIDLNKFNNCDKCKCDVLRDEIQRRFGSGNRSDQHPARCQQHPCQPFAVTQDRHA